MDDRNSQLVLEAGTVVAGEYRVERVLAESAMSLYVVATHVQSEQRVAVGLLRCVTTLQWDAMDRFAHEANAAVGLRSEHVARVFEAGVTAEWAPYIVTEYLECRSLAWELQAHGPFDVASVAEYAIQACDGLAEAHAQSIVHRDINPSNLFLIQREPGCCAIKIVDFGISNFALCESADLVAGKPRGGPCYMSPEQLASNATVDHRSDIWSIGVTIHELLAGKPPFWSSDARPAPITSVLKNPAPWLSEVRADVPEALAGVVARCLSKDREMRFQNAGELAMALLPFAPARASITAERAASRSPAFPREARETEAASADGPLSGDRTETGSSLAPTSTTLVATGDAPSSAIPAGEPENDTSQTSTESSSDSAIESELPRLRLPPWVGAATLAAAVVLVFSAILVAASDGGIESGGGVNPAAPSMAAAARTVPEVPPAPTPVHEATDPGAPELVEAVMRSSPATARLTVDGGPQTEVPAGPSTIRMGD